MLPLSEKKVKHCGAVAKFLFENTRLTDRRDEMYVLGLLHDVGYLKTTRGHNKAGAEILKNLGYKDWIPVAEHGDPNTNQNTMTDELNWADMQIDHEGNLVGYEERLLSISKRYGENSAQYIDASRIVKRLIEKGYPDIGKSGDQK